MIYLNKGILKPYPIPIPYHRIGVAKHTLNAIRDMENFECKYEILKHGGESDAGEVGHRNHRVKTIGYNFF